MPLSTVATGEPVKASTTNAMIHNVNGSPGRAIFKVNGTWSVPSGVYRFKVYLAGGGGARGFDYDFGEDSRLGGDGGDSPLCSKIYGSYDVGTSFSIVIGAGATTAGADGGTSTFGTVLQSTGGGGGSPGSDGTPLPGSRGTHTGEMAHDNDLFLAPEVKGFGTGGRTVVYGLYVSTKAASDGICIIEW